MLAESLPGGGEVGKQLKQLGEKEARGEGWKLIRDGCWRGFFGMRRLTLVQSRPRDAIAQAVKLQGNCDYPCQAAFAAGRDGPARSQPSSAPTWCSLARGKPHKAIYGVPMARSCQPMACAFGELRPAHGRSCST
eukprot:g15502.t1